MNFNKCSCEHIMFRMTLPLGLKTLTRFPFFGDMPSINQLIINQIPWTSIPNIWFNCFEEREFVFFIFYRICFKYKNLIKFIFLIVVDPFLRARSKQAQVTVYEGFFN